MSSEQSKCRGYVIDESSLALFIGKSATTAFGFWIPRSQIGYLKRTKAVAPERDFIEFTCPDWLLEKNDAWDLVP